jgi:hypothetical protein
MGYFVKRSFRKDFRSIILREKIGFKKKSSKKVGLGSGATDLAQGEMGHGNSRCRKGR